jgi:hypothetical protein
VANVMGVARARALLDGSGAAALRFPRHAPPPPLGVVDVDGCQHAPACISQSPVYVDEAHVAIFDHLLQAQLLRLAGGVQDRGLAGGGVKVLQAGREWGGGNKSGCAGQGEGGAGFEARAGAGVEAC